MMQYIQDHEFDTQTNQEAVLSMARHNSEIREIDGHLEDDTFDTPDNNYRGVDQKKEETITRTTVTKMLIRSSVGIVQNNDEEDEARARMKEMH